jgi:hypothetical protein
MAFDLLSVPCTFCEIESSAKELITPIQNSLSEETIELRELLRNWWLNGFVTPSDIEYKQQHHDLDDHIPE